MEESNVFVELALFAVLIAGSIMVYISLEKENYDD